PELAEDPSVLGRRRRRGGRRRHPRPAPRWLPATPSLLRLRLGGSDPSLDLAQDAPRGISVAEHVPHLHRDARLVLADLLDGDHEGRAASSARRETLLEESPALLRDLEAERAERALHSFDVVVQRSREGLRHVPRPRRLVAARGRRRRCSPLVTLLRWLLGPPARDRSRDENRPDPSRSLRRRRHAGSSFAPLPAAGQTRDAGGAPPPRAPR